jgi:hypothetical protein
MGRVKVHGFAVARSGRDAGVELSASETDRGTISGGGAREGAATWELRAGIEPGEVPGGGAETGASPLGGSRTDVGGGTSGERRGLEVNAETLRSWMKDAGLWQRQLREAKAHFGELVQLDSSFHEWLEGRGPRGCLMHIVDDATTKALGGLRGRNDPGGGSLTALDRALRRAGGLLHGLKKRVCTARRMPKSGSAENRQAVTQLGRMCAMLGIRSCMKPKPGTFLRWYDNRKIVAVDINLFRVYVDLDSAVGRVKLSLSFTSEGASTAGYSQVIAHIPQVLLRPD